MQTRFAFLLLLSFLAINESHSQEQQPLRKKLVTKLDKAWFGNGSVTKILENKQSCENLVGRLKTSGKSNKELESQYLMAKNAYDIVLDTMQADINRAVDVKDIFFLLATSQERKSKYAELGENADTLCVSFKKSAESALNDKMGLIYDIIDWAKVLIIPSWAEKLAEEVRDALKIYYSNRINGLRFKSWDEI